MNPSLAPDRRADLLNALRTVIEPELRKDLVTLGMVKEARSEGEQASITLSLAPAQRPASERIERDVRTAMMRAGFTSAEVSIVWTGESPARTASSGVGGHATPLPQVRHVVAVGAGKGGVGKSTVAVNLAVGLQRTGHAVGLLDGDIYGPSVPTMLGIRGMTPRLAAGGQKIVPHHVHGIHAVTIGSLVEQEKPLIWRGPMAHGAFKQLLIDNTDWPTLDYLVVDLPPGTGDVPLTLCQLLPLSGAIVVATPQQVAIDDATRATRMFQQLGCPVLGVVENMSVFVTPDGSEHDLFGRGGAKAMAGRLSLPFLGELPLYPELRRNTDAGRPHANFDTDPRLREALERIAAGVAGEVARLTLADVVPSLTIRE